MTARRQGKSLFVMVGDLSADRHVSHVAHNLKTAIPDLTLWGVGGPAMANAGIELLYDCQKFSVIGIIGVLKYLPYINQVKKTVLSEIESRKPDMVLLCDFGAFNLRLSQDIKKRWPKLPIVYFISPQVWGSRPWRIKTIDKNVEKMLVIYPFEKTLYQKRGVDAAFVGNPYTSSLPQIEDLCDKESFCKKHKLDPNKPIIAIFPGSRKQELHAHMPVVMDGATWLLKERPQLQFVIVEANPVIKEAIESYLAKHNLTHILSKGLYLAPPGDNYEVMANADLIWAKSGTTTLEAALYGKPMLIFYRGDWLSYLILLCFKTVKRIGWPNLLAGYGLVPELLMLDCRAEKLVRYTTDWLDVPAYRKQLTDKLKALKSELGVGLFTDNTSKEILTVLQSSDKNAIEAVNS